MSIPNPVPSDPDSTLRVFTFNVWGLKFISSDRPVRIKAIAEYLASSSYDIVCLQELWIYKDYEIIKGEVQQNLPFSRFFHTGALGSGLAIFTRFPIISAQALPYSLSGSPAQVIAGDFFVKKAAGNIVVLHPLLGEVEIWNTHMHAAGENPPDTRQAHRIAQSWQLANAIRGGAAKGRYILTTGDFNAQPYSIPIAILRQHAGMSDSFFDTHPSANSAISPLPSPQRALQLLGMTCDSSLNSYSAGKPIPDNIKSQGGKRLDYIFYRQPEIARRRPLIWGYRDEEGTPNGTEGTGGDLEQGKPLHESVRHAPRLRCIRSEVTMTDRVPGHNFSYSDHFALVSTFKIEKAPGHDQQKKAPEQPTSGSGSSNTDGKKFTPLIPLMADPEPLNSTTTTFGPMDSPSPRTSLSSGAKSSTIRSALTILRMYNTISQRTARLHLRLFATAVVCLLGLTIGSAWQPKSWLQPIFTLLGGVCGAGGATMLYTGFVWGKWEQGILSETFEEMDLELRVVEMEERGVRP
ncbi:inositol phosphorylsphingolipid-phospholipase C [Naematelia encephala]|uniref:Inositol phosphorylsphingolipid-phospholipase C n=1 Tax=Naematelia encephala TaxID=71784 RepID=A0A1Y2B3U6_9TREE|nr:inositol phosphorylsphingolipid-phospholipase C [Naematelia encephala]